MRIDSYENPEAERLLRSGRERHADPRRARATTITEAAGAVLFLVCAVLLATLATSPRTLSAWPLAATAITYLIAARVTFPVGSAWTRPTQLAFVPMLFVLPTPLVPLIVAACLLIDLWPHALGRSLSPALVLTRLGDSFYALGPAFVLVVAGDQVFSWNHWPVFLLAFAAQVVCDGGAGLARTWFAERIAPQAQLPMLWLYVTDACLSYIGLLIAAEAVTRPGLVLLATPLIGLLWLFARERRVRLERTLALSTAYRGTALLLGDIVEADDHYTGLHSRDVVDLSLAVSEALGLDAEQLRTVEFGALLHDVGKIRVPKEIINKPGKLDPWDWVVIRRHTLEGETMLRQVGGRLAGIGRIVRSSHERYDGRGYPDGLIGEEIPIEARIVCACDAYSAMTTDRPYRPALSLPDALAELRRCSGTQFDPLVVEALERLLGITVRLQGEPTTRPRVAMPETLKLFSGRAPQPPPRPVALRPRSARRRRPAAG